MSDSNPNRLSTGICPRGLLREVIRTLRIVTVVRDLISEILQARKIERTKTSVESPRNSLSPPATSQAIESKSKPHLLLLLAGIDDSNEALRRRPRPSEAAIGRRRQARLHVQGRAPAPRGGRRRAPPSCPRSPPQPSDSSHRRDHDRDCDRRVRNRERERDKELGTIREQYLGSKKPKKQRVIKPSEKFRFSFEWENTEATFRDINALYQNPHEARVLSGRGFIAGSDQREQKKPAALHEKETREEIRRKEGVEERPEEAAADLYDIFDMRVERHWSEKKIEEMTKRDWRVFMILSGAFNVAPEGGVPEEDAGLVHIVEQAAGVGHVSGRHQRKQDPGEEAVLAGEAGGEEKGVALFEVGGVGVG